MASGNLQKSSLGRAISPYLAHLRHGPTHSHDPMSVARGSQRGVRDVDLKEKRGSIEMGSRGGTRSERPASTTGRESVRSARSLRSAAAASSSAAGPSHAPPSSSGRSRNSTDRLIAEPSRNNSVSSGGRGSSRAASRDLSLAAYILKVRTVAASCDAALEKQKANFQKVPEEMIELQIKIVGVLRLVEETEGEERGGGWGDAHTHGHHHTRSHALSLRLFPGTHGLSNLGITAL